MPEPSPITLSRIGKNETGACVEITLDGKRVGHLAYATSDDYVELVGASLQAPVLVAPRAPKTTGAAEPEAPEEQPGAAWVTEQQDRYVRALLGDGARVLRDRDGSVRIQTPPGPGGVEEVQGANWDDAFRATLRLMGTFQGAVRMLADRVKQPVIALKSRLSTTGQDALRTVPGVSEDDNSFSVEPAA